MTRLPLILDCDPGITDALALYFALAHPGVDLKAVTTTFGNVSVAQATRNALVLCQLAQRQLPVHSGVATPLRKAPRHPDTEYHGADGLGNQPQPIAPSAGSQEHSAARCIVALAQAHPGTLSVVTTGPLGNLAQALRLEPHLPQLLRQVVVTGGSIAAPGDVSPVAETNCWLDPHAADIVLTAGFPLTLVGLDVAYRLPLPLALFERLANQRPHPATAALLHGLRHATAQQSARYPELAAQTACYAPDLLALLWLLQPRLFSAESGRIRVATEGLAEGQTIMDRREHLAYPQSGWEQSLPRSQACLGVQAQDAQALIEETLARDWLTPAA